MGGGEGAIAFDPLSAQGVFKALHSGLWAGRSINAHFTGAKSALLDYAASLEEEFEVYLGLRSRYYRREIRWPDSVFWQRRTFRMALSRYGLKNAKDPVFRLS